ncbi:MAG: hypothetical protein ACRDI0_13290 [Actinomycetota bacterium]
MGDVTETARVPAEARITVPERLRRQVEERVRRRAGEALQRLASAPQDCPLCGAVGAVRSRYCDVCNAPLGPGAAAALPPAAAPAPDTGRERRPRSALPSNRTSCQIVGGVS